MTKANIKQATHASSQPDQPPVNTRGFTGPNQQLWVEVNYKGAKELIEYRRFVADRSSMWTSLADKGLVIISKAAKASLYDQVESLKEFPPRLIFARPGWCHGQFVTASGRIFAPKGVQKGAVAFTPDALKCSKKGSHAKWRAEIAQRLTDHPIPCFFLLTCFAAPMLEVVGRTDNFGFELAGQGGKGKSTTQRLMASVVGPAMDKDRGYITTFNMTPAALEESMLGHSDMPFIIDEANLYGSGEGGRANKRKMQEFAFQMAGGTTKGRYGNAQQKGYRFIFATSANQPFNQLLGESHTDIANAATDRLMSITVPEGDAGVFGPLPEELQSYRELTLALETAMMRQYGTAMPKFLSKLVRQRHTDEAGLKTAIRRRIDEFKREVGINDNNGSDVRVAEAFGLVYTSFCETSSSCSTVSSARRTRCSAPSSPVSTSNAAF